MSPAMIVAVVPLLAARLADKMPEPEDVKAGWLGFAVFLALAAVVVFLSFSLRKHLGRVDFEEPETTDSSTNGDTLTNGDTPTPTP
jgi:hypothetical protein